MKLDIEITGACMDQILSDYMERAGLSALCSRLDRAARKQVSRYEDINSDEARALKAYFAKFSKAMQDMCLELSKEEDKF